MGRTDEGIREINRAYDLDPLSVVIVTDVGKVLTLARRYDDAVAQYEKALAMDPEFGVARGLLALTLSLQRKHAHAIAEINRIRHLDGSPMYVSWLGYVHGAAQNHSEAASALRHLDELALQTYVSPLWFMLLHTGMGNTDEAFHWCQKVFAEHAAGGAIPLKANPLFDPIRSDPRYFEVLSRAGLGESVAVNQAANTSR